VQLCSSHERSGQKLLAVQLPRGCLRFCMAVAVPDSALSCDAEQSVEPIHTGATGRSGLRGIRWPVTSMSSMQLASWRAPGLSQRKLGARVPAPAERRIQRPCVLRTRPSGTSAGGGLDYRGENMALHPAAPTPPPSADRAMHSTRAQDAYEPRIADLRPSPSGAQYAPRVVSKCVVKITWYRKVVFWSD